MKEIKTATSFVGEMRAGRQQLGIRSQICSTMVAEALGMSGYDYVYLDMEHSPNDLMSIMQQGQALAGTQAHAVVRLPTMDTVLIQQLLDCGIENIVVPMVETADQARAAVSAMRYPPKGSRSVAKVHRGNGYASQTDYADTIEDRLCLIVQAESGLALQNIGEIAAVEGVHGVLFGPGDLAADLGYLGRATHPEVEAAISKGIAAIHAAGTFAGMSTGDGITGRRWLEAGCNFVSIGGDLQILVEQARRFVKDARS